MEKCEKTGAAQTGRGSLIGLGSQSNLTFSVIASFQIRVVPTAYGVDLSDVFSVP
jgi:hypothetical protein